VCEQQGETNKTIVGKLFTIIGVLAGMLYPPISWPVREVRKVPAAGGCKRNVSFITW